jgi:hypothetical protein
LFNLKPFALQVAQQVNDPILNPQLAIDFANRDLQRLTGRINLSLMLRAPYLDILDSGVFENGISDEQRTMVAERPILGFSQTLPVAINDTDMCGLQGPNAQAGSTEYITRLGTFRGAGPTLCVKVARSAFQESYMAVQDGLRKQLVQFHNIDSRATLFLRSGVKCKLNTGRTMDNMLSGDFQRIDVSVNDTTPPNATINFSVVSRLTQLAHEDLQAESWDMKDPADSVTNTVSKFIGSLDAVEALRQDLDVKQDLRSLVSGRYDLGVQSLTGYSWEGPYRGIAFGLDQRPLRFNVFQTLANGQVVPNFVEPEITVSVSKGVAPRANPSWRDAKYEVAFLCFANSFIRKTPEQYTGVGDWRFPAQFANGELEFTVIRDSFNPYGDMGKHYWQVIRAFTPLRPHCIIPIMYARCASDLGLTTCSLPYAGASTASFGI